MPHVLPDELIAYIYLIVKKDSCADKIGQFYKLRLKQKDLMKSLIMILLYPPMDKIGYHLLTDENIINLRFILNNNYPKTYDKCFWQNLLTLLSYQLMAMSNWLLLNNLNVNSNFRYRNLKIAIEIWFRMCQKYHIKLLLSNLNCGKLSQTRVKARHIVKIKQFSNYRFAPMIVDNRAEYETIIVNRACRYLRNFYV